MYSIKIRDHIMIAHSFKDKVFGPAQKLHGATYIVDVSFFARELNGHNIVIDISKAQEILRMVLEPLKFQNLDEFEMFKGKLTTTEFMAKYIHDKMKENSSGFFKGKISVTIGESHIAWATYEEDVE
jgi:6-pyruvoyltetrahydropterin/6-carboxytetrahydropterin synthase